MCLLELKSKCYPLIRNPRFIYAGKLLKTALMIHGLTLTLCNQELLLTRHSDIIPHV
jgi:hypothetical protein